MTGDWVLWGQKKRVGRVLPNTDDYERRGLQWVETFSVFSPVICYNEELTVFMPAEARSYFEQFGGEDLDQNI